MISEEQEREPAPDVEVNIADTHDLPAADPDPWERGDFENEGPEPARLDANGPGAGEPEAQESETGEPEAGDSELDESKVDRSEAGESEASESETGESDAGIQPEDTGANDTQSGKKDQDDGNAGEEEPNENEANEDEADTAELKVVLHVRNGRTNAGVWQPGTDPHLEVFLETDTDVILNELPGLIERARARWADNPMRPKYNPPKVKKQNKKSNKQPSGQPPGQPSNKPSGQPSGQPQLGNVEEQTGMARLF